MTTKTDAFRVPDGGRFEVVDAETEEVFTVSQIVEQLPWRANDFAPHEPRMPAHEYVRVPGLEGEPERYARMLEELIVQHPRSYKAYFRGYQRPMQYLEVGSKPSDYRYWRSGGRGGWYVNRCRLDSVEPPHRVDQGAKPIPPEEWGSKEAFWPQGSGWGTWRREGGEWVFYPEDAPGSN